MGNESLRIVQGSDGIWRIPAYQLAGFLAGHVAAAIESVAEDVVAGRMVLDVESVADVAFEVALEELADRFGHDVANRIGRLEATRRLTEALAAHALPAGLEGLV